MASCHVYQNILKSRYIRFEECAQLELVSADFRKLIVSQCYRRYRSIDLSSFRGFEYEKLNLKKICMELFEKICTYCTNVQRLDRLQIIRGSPLLEILDFLPRLAKLRYVDFSILNSYPHQEIFEYLDFLKRIPSLTNLTAKLINDDVQCFDQGLSDTEELKNRRWEVIELQFVHETGGDNNDYYTPGKIAPIFRHFSAEALIEFTLKLFYAPQSPNDLNFLPKFLRRCSNLEIFRLDLHLDDTKGEEWRCLIVEFADSLYQLNKLTTLFVNISFTDEDFKRFPEYTAILISACRFLKNLSFYEPAEDLLLISIATNVPDLENVCIIVDKFSKDKISSNGWRYLLNLRKLKSLKMYDKYSSIDRGIFNYIPAMTDCDSLQKLKLDNIRINRELVGKIFALKALRSFSFVHNTYDSSLIVPVFVIGNIGNRLEHLEMILYADLYGFTHVLKAIAYYCPNLISLTIDVIITQLSLDLCEKGHHNIGLYLSGIGEKCRRLQFVDFSATARNNPFPVFGDGMLILTFMEHCRALQEFTVHPECFQGPVWQHELLKPYKHKLLIVEPEY